MFAFLLSVGAGLIAFRRPSGLAVDFLFQHSYPNRAVGRFRPEGSSPSLNDARHAPGIKTQHYSLTSNT